MSVMQTCTKYHETKLIEQFSWKNKKRGKRQTQCKTCHSAYRRKHYLANDEKYKKKAKKWNDSYRADHITKLRRHAFEHLLSNPCIDCGETNPVMLEFDHVRGEKNSEVSVMMKNAVSLARLKREIAKCEVRCANCHRLKTAKEGGWQIIELMAEYQIDT